MPTSATAAPSPSPPPSPSPLAEHHQLHGAQPVLPVPDVVAAADWFIRILGFEIDFFLGDPVSYGRVKLGTDGRWGDAVYIHLQHGDDSTVLCSKTRLHVGYDIDGLHAHLLAEGATVLAPPTDQPWGLRELTLQAPGGHLLVLGAEISQPQPDNPP